jgi:hypothetical protein
MHPPFGFALFYLRSVAPKKIKTRDIYWGAVPFVIIQILTVALIIFYPDIIHSDNKEKHPQNIDLQIQNIPNENIPIGNTIPSFTHSP